MQQKQQSQKKSQKTHIDSIITQVPKKHQSRSYNVYAKIPVRWENIKPKKETNKESKNSDAIYETKNLQTDNLFYVGHLWLAIRSTYPFPGESPLK